MIHAPSRLAVADEGRGVVVWHIGRARSLNRCGGVIAMFVTKRPDGAASYPLRPFRCFREPMATPVALQARTPIAFVKIAAPPAALPHVDQSRYVEIACGAPQVPRPGIPKLSHRGVVPHHRAACDI